MMGKNRIGSFPAVPAPLSVASGLLGSDLVFCGNVIIGSAGNGRFSVPISQLPEPAIRTTCGYYRCYCYQLQSSPYLPRAIPRSFEAYWVHSHGFRSFFLFLFLNRKGSGVAYTIWDSPIIAGCIIWQINRLRKDLSCQFEWQRGWYCSSFLLQVPIAQLNMSRLTPLLNV